MSVKKSSEVYEEIQKVLVNYSQQANEWARFSQRQTQINAETFVQTLVLGWLQNPEASLNELAQSARELGLRLSGSALHERIGPEAVMLLAGVLKLALDDLRTPCPLPLTLLRQFRGIYITDSTQIALPSSMAALFRGNQDNSMLKVQVVWDYLNGNLAAIELEEGRSPDQNCTLHVRHAHRGSLHLFDLGYFKQEYLRDIDQQAAYFISRYQCRTAVYDVETQQRLELASLLKHVVGDQVDCQVLLGGRVKLGVRLVARRLSQQAADARRRKAKKKARKQGQTCTADYLLLLGWDILVTNLEPQVWTVAHLFDFYAIRFQIEWMFRTWKTQLGVDKLGKWRVERVLCQLYARLLGAILTHLLTAPWRWRAGEYSFAKCVQVIQLTIPRLMRCMAHQGRGGIAWVRQLTDNFQRFGRKTKRRKSPSTTQIIYNWGLP